MKCLAILVNFHGARLIVDAARSLADDPECDEIEIVDNSVAASEADYLQEHLPARAHLTVAERNLGFAGACNLAFRNTDADCVLLLNPDARLLPGALARLKRTLAESPGAAAVGPRVYWDEERHFLLPPTTYPSRSGFFLDQLGRCIPPLARYRALGFRRRSLREWQATGPFPVDALSGGHVLLRRSALMAAGGLFDPDFFMYWEDSDLMRRLQDRGFSLWLDPRAEAIHLYEHSPRKDQLIGQGWPAFAAKYFATRPWRWLIRAADRLQRRGPAPRSFARIEPTAPAGIAMDVPEAWQGGWLLEFSPSPDFVPAIGRLGSGAVAFLPGALAARFSGRDYHLRLTPRAGGARQTGLSFTVAGDELPAEPAQGSRQAP